MLGTKHCVVTELAASFTCQRKAVLLSKMLAATREVFVLWVLFDPSVWFLSIYSAERTVLGTSYTQDLTHSSQLHIEVGTISPSFYMRKWREGEITYFASK